MSTPTYHQCLNAGMSQAETARARGVSSTAVHKWQNRHGVEFQREKGLPSTASKQQRDDYAAIMKGRAYNRAEALELLGVRA
jgi:uncharacterized protein YjcR